MSHVGRANHAVRDALPPPASGGGTDGPLFSPLPLVVDQLINRLVYGKGVAAHGRCEPPRHSPSSVGLIAPVSYWGHRTLDELPSSGAVPATRQSPPPPSLPVSRSFRDAATATHELRMVGALLRHFYNVGVSGSEVRVLLCGGFAAGDRAAPSCVDTLLPLLERESGGYRCHCASGGPSGASPTQEGGSVEVVFAGDELPAKSMPSRSVLLVALGIGLNAYLDLRAPDAQASFVPLHRAPRPLTITGYSTGSAAAGCAPITAAALHRATAAVVFVGHVMWSRLVPSPTAAVAGTDTALPACLPDHGYWQPLRIALAKLTEEGDGSDPQVTARPPLVSSVIALCCPRHVANDAKLLKSDAGDLDAAVDHFCLAPCTSRFGCGVAGHACLRTCHPSAHDGDGHAACPYPCAKTLPCGHACQMLCTEGCDCLEVIEVPLPCTHVTAAQSAANSSVTVRHGLRLRCRDVWNGVALDVEAAISRLALHCDVAVPFTCSACCALTHVPCHTVQLDAAASRDKKDVVVCASCLAKERTIRSETRLQLIREAEAEKEKRFRDVELQIFEQQKAAKAGIFKEGQLVAITNCCAIRGKMPDLFEDLVSNDDRCPDDDDRGGTAAAGGIAKPRWLETSADTVDHLLGEVGTVLGRQVDFVDTTEVLYLLRLNRMGRCLVVADAGLTLQKATIDAEGSRLGANAPHSTATSGGLLLLTDGPGAASSGAGDGVDARRALFPVGTMVHITQPCDCVDATTIEEAPRGGPSFLAAAILALVRQHRMDATTATLDPAAQDANNDSGSEPATQLTDVVGRVSRSFAGGTHAATALVEVDLVVEMPGVASRHHDDESGEPPRKEARRHPSDPAVSSAPLKVRVVVSVPLSSMEVCPLVPGAVIVVRHPWQHIYGRKERLAFALSVDLAKEGFVPVPLGDGEGCAVRSLANYPVVALTALAPSGDIVDGRKATLAHPFGRSKGPCAVVTPQRGRNAGKISLVPLHACELDTESVAEGALNAAVIVRLEEVTRDRFEAYCNEQAISNLELQAKRAKLAAMMASRSTTAAAPKIAWSTGGRSGALPTDDDRRAAAARHAAAVTATSSAAPALPPFRPPPVQWQPEAALDATVVLAIVGAVRQRLSRPSAPPVAGSSSSGVGGSAAFPSWAQHLRR